ncbi:hypothetical protein OCGS_2234 [Oceaniovalibus guishaninsula JLT2003]|uniref:Uncharacterized protein n=1 Tax=Oceaniovalibus guishaninsula JLT2003 TaxID=1231392 RepID=K2HA44_9RHOB|nr:DUF6477 family protein [Oceaniovalibus guishaninsula]EKE43502.1 hypothetical protein OCGS_2234 [Oceaniovalibus guishaninsula JLT2003]
MQLTLTAAPRLNRPALLVRAARIAMKHHDRDKALHRLLGAARPPAPAESQRRLAEIESDLNDLRRAGDAAYDVVRHVGVLTALMGEVRLLHMQEVEGGAARPARPALTLVSG